MYVARKSPGIVCSNGIILAWYPGRVGASFSFMLAACNCETTQFELAASLLFGSQRSGDSTRHRELVGAHCSCAPG